MERVLLTYRVPKGTCRLEILTTAGERFAVMITESQIWNLSVRAALGVEESYLRELLKQTGDAAVASITVPDELFAGMSKKESRAKVKAIEESSDSNVVKPVSPLRTYEYYACEAVEELLAGTRRQIEEYPHTGPGRTPEYWQLVATSHKLFSELERRKIQSGKKFPNL